MGDYSRDSYQITNIMHQLLGGNSVSDARHYVGVRLEQGVPMLDADWNEKEDILRNDERLKLRHFFGEGVPSDNNGFAAGPVTADNDFTIETGMAIVDGMLVINQHENLTYLEQVAALGVTVTPLTTPPGIDRTDLIYLDVWEEEVGSSGSVADERLVNPVIGVHTCNRIERRWMVRVAEGVDDIAGVTVEAGHSYMAIALMNRQAGEDRIRAERFQDLRRTDVNVVKHLKIPLFVSRGTDFVDSDRFANVLDDLHNILSVRHSDELLFIDMSSFTHPTMVLLLALQDLIQMCSTGAMQARTRNLTNESGLSVLETLVSAQQYFIDNLSDHGVSGVPKDEFIADYQLLLDDVNTAVDNSRLLDGYLSQQALNAWLSAASGVLPEGTVSIQFTAIDPTEPLVAGTAYDVFVEVVSGVTSSAGNEIIDLEASLSSNLWQVSPAMQAVTLANNGGSQIISFQVTPNTANLNSDLSVVASVRNNPTITSTQLPLSMEIGVEPLTGGVLNYAGPPLNSFNRLELSSGALTNGLGTIVAFELRNHTSDNHTYTIEWFAELTVGDDTDWVPLAASPRSNTVSVNNDSIGGVHCSIVGPTGGSVSGNQGILHVVLTEVDGTPVPEPDQEAVDIEFECV